MIEVIDEGVRKGRFRPLEARTAALAVAGMCNWVAWWYHPGGEHDQSPENAADQIADLAVAMVRQTSVRTPETPGPRAALALLRQDLDHLERILDEQARADA